MQYVVSFAGSLCLHVAAGENVTSLRLGAKTKTDGAKLQLGSALSKTQSIGVRTR